MAGPHATQSDPRPFLSIITWPDGYDRAALARLLAHTAGIDMHSARIRLGQRPPTIIGQIDPGPAHRAVDAIVRASGDAFAPTLEEMVRLGPTMRIQQLHLDESGHLNVDLWRGLSTTIHREDVRILIRGTSKSVEKTRRIRIPTYKASGHRSPFGSDYVETSRPETNRKIRVTNTLDIHTSNGSVYRIIGRRFDYAILEKMRTYRDADNMDRFCDLLVHLAPDAIVDDFYSLWKPPAGHRRLRVPGATPNDDRPFTFYSRWAALMYRHILGFDNI